MRETCRLSLNADGGDAEKELTRTVKYEISFFVEDQRHFEEL